jgi:hypothetical protein
MMIVPRAELAAINSGASLSRSNLLPLEMRGEVKGAARVSLAFCGNYLRMRI